MTSHEDIQKDIDILKLMIIKIAKYFNKTIYISDLIYDLESYLNQLMVVDEEWKVDFRTTWLDIEVAYALALHQGLDEPADDGSAIVVHSLKILNKMVKDKIENLKIALKSICMRNCS